MKAPGISLRELQAIIRQAVEALPATYWVVAEVSELRETAAGHCFLELVQKSEEGDGLEAKAAANIWASVYRMAKPYFSAEAGTPLARGMKVLVRVAVQYHELYGLRLNVLDIDPAYTLGEMALARRRSIEQLQADGVLDMNRELALPLLPRRIAVISSEGAAGYGDFMRQLHGNPRRYAFGTTLFAATMQGKGAEASIIAALAQVHAAAAPPFDAVAILRGGGAQSDLSCFDSYQLASHVAQFPLPVITGIGHDRDTSLVDMVACHALKTPTAAAELLLACYAAQDERIAERSAALSAAWAAAQTRGAAQLQRLALGLAAAVGQRVQGEKHRLDALLPQRLRYSAAQRLRYSALALDKLSEALKLSDPAALLRRGYSITLCNGKLLKSAADAHAGDRLTTILHDGRVESCR